MAGGKSYTGKGDDGNSCLGSGARLSKSHEIFEAVGALDELGSIIGAAKAGTGNAEKELEEIQADLFEAGSIVSGAWKEEKAKTFEEKLARLEKEIDVMDEKLPPINHFILAGGTPFAARLQLCRAVARKAERRARALEMAEFSPILKYLNRLSSYFFARARFENMKAGVKETEWKGK